MAWQPRWRHVSQLFRHAGDAPGALEGASDCFEASLARYLREAAYPFAGDDSALVAAMRLLATGQPDHSGQGYTWLDQAGRALTTLGIGWRWTSGLSEARAATWAICWVRAARLRTATPNLTDGRRVYTDYPLWWLGGADEPDHFILWLPNGSFNDPLSYWNGGRDTVYTDTSVATAFAGAFILDSLPQVVRSAPDRRHNGNTTAGGAFGSHRGGPTLVVNCAEGLRLREAPSASATVLATLPDGEALRDAYDKECLWTFVYAGELGLHGWVRRELTRVVSR